jgi:DNA polymerase-3 subunit delta
MYKKEFDNILKTNSLDFSAYMFWGQSDYLVEEYALKVALALSNNEEINKVYFEEYNFDKCLDILSSSSLFSSTNILLIKIQKKLPKKDVDKLINACIVNTSSKVIFSCLGDATYKDMAKSFTKKTLSAEVRFFTPFDNEIIAILNQKALEFGVQTDANTLMHLYNMHQKDLSLSVSDLSKLSILEEQITSKTINNHCFGLGSVDIEEFLIKLFSKQKIAKDLYFILEEGMNEIQLITRITIYTQHLFMINTYLKLHGVLDIKAIWGYALPKNIANQQASIASKFKKDDFIDMLNYLQDLELELKSSKLIDTNAYVQAKLRTFIK